jgi:L-iditol 2-dehydrogenase
MEMMKAVVKYDNISGATQIREVPIPETGADDVLVKIAYIGVCGTDPHMHHNKVSFKVNVPLILGHEFSGTIEKVGENVKGYKAGQRVTAETHAQYCGVCTLCRTNRYHLCRERKGYGFQTNGAFAKYVNVPARILHCLPDEVSLKDASLTEPLCVAYKAVIVNSTVRPADRVVVIGPGPIGLLCCKMASIAGAGEVIMIGTRGDDKRLVIAKGYGATRCIDSSKEDPTGFVMGGGDGYGADLVIDTAGVSSTLKLSMELARPEGQITKVGWGPEPVGFSLDPLIAKSITLKGHFSHTWDVWEKCLRLVSNRQVELAPLITHELSISEWKRAFELVENKEALKVVLTPI